MNQILMYGTFAFLGIVVLMMLISILMVARNKPASIWITRISYLSGGIAVLLNLVRMIIAFDEYKGTLIFANVIVLLCIVISAGRQEMARKMPPEADGQER